MKRIFSKTAISTKASSNFLLYSAITLSILFNYFLYEGGKRQMQTEKYLEIEKREEIERRLKKSTKEQNKVSDQEELKRKMTEYYKGASDQEIDKFIIGLTNAKKKVLPQKLNKAVTLYKVEYIKDGNVVGYAYEVNADNLGLTEKELVAGKQNLTYSLREHHKRYFCTSPTIRMELDIGIDFFITIVSAIDNNVGSYRISKGDCIS